MVRHGQAYNTHRQPGEPYPANPPLTPIGVRQAELVADRLARLPIDRLVSSPMLRTVETASIVGKRTGHRVEVWTRCYEFRKQPGYLCWGAREVLARYPEVTMPEDFGPDDWEYGEEALESAIERADALIAWLREHAAEGTIGQMAIVTHGAYTRLVLGRLLEVDPANLQAVTLDNTALCTIELTLDALRILALNDTAHLEGAGEADPLVGVTR
jgi:probable phosphoglycerate mutase